VHLETSSIALADYHPQYTNESLKSSLLNLQCLPQIASSSTICNFLLHFSCHSIALNLIFTTYTLSPTFPNFLSSFQQMEPMPCQVSNHYWKKNQEAHLERALTFKKAANLHCPSNEYLPTICLCTLDWGWLMHPMSLMKQDDHSNQEITDDQSLCTGECPVSSDIEDYNLDQQHKGLLLCKALQDKSLRTKWVPLEMNRSHADTVTARSLLSIPWQPAGEMAPPLLKCPKATLLNQ